MYIIKWKTSKGIITGMARYADFETARRQMKIFADVFPHGTYWIVKES